MSRSLPRNRATINPLGRVVPVATVAGYAPVERATGRGYAATAISPIGG